MPYKDIYDLAPAYFSRLISRNGGPLLRCLLTRALYMLTFWLSALHIFCLSAVMLSSTPNSYLPSRGHLLHLFLCGIFMFLKIKLFIPLSQHLFYYCDYLPAAPPPFLFFTVRLYNTVARGIDSIARLLSPDFAAFFWNDLGLISSSLWVSVFHLW